MTDLLSVLDHLPETMRQPIRQYAGLVEETVGSAVRELALFGPIASGTFDASCQAARNVLVVDTVDLQSLKRLGVHGPSLGKLGIAAPLIMTPRYIHASLDTFPLEFIEIQQVCLTVLGEGHFTGLVFEEPDVRLQCERELKALLIGLRQGLLASAGEDRFVAALVRDMGEALLRTLRGMLWLEGVREAKPAAGVLEEIERVTGQQLGGVRGILDPSATHGWAAFESFYEDVERLGEMVDAR